MFRYAAFLSSDIFDAAHTLTQMSEAAAVQSPLRHDIFHCASMSATPYYACSTKCALFDIVA